MVGDVGVVVGDVGVVIGAVGVSDEEILDGEELLLLEAVVPVELLLTDCGAAWCAPQPRQLAITATMNASAIATRLLIKTSIIKRLCGREYQASCTPRIHGSH